MNAPATSRGFSLMDVIVGVALFGIILMALAGVLRASLSLSTYAKVDAAASAIAQSQMEYLRGFAYGTLGTVGGIPPGTVPQTASSTVDGVFYTTHTFIEYYDDPADGLGASDANHITTDYKVARVEVDYTYGGHAHAVVLASNFVPPSLETSNGGGTLEVAVTDASGAALPNATVQINNASTSPTVALTATSNALGIVDLPGAATSSQYQVSVSATGDSSAQTYQRTPSNPNPSPGYLTVAKDKTTTGTFAIDKLATFSLTTYHAGTTTPLEGVSYTLTGAKTIGTTAGGAPIYKNVVSGTTAAVTGSDSKQLEWDAYTLAVAGYDVADSCTPPPYAVAPGSAENISLYLAAATPNSLLISVADNTGAPVAGAFVNLTKSGTNLLATTTACGNAYFGNLSGATYTGNISRSGTASTTFSNIAVSSETYFAAAFP